MDPVSAEKFESLVYFKCLRALAEPGESVGLLAAQVRPNATTFIIQQSHIHEQLCTIIM